MMQSSRNCSTNKRSPTTQTTSSLKATKKKFRLSLQSRQVLHLYRLLNHTSRSYLQLTREDLICPLTNRVRPIRITTTIWMRSVIRYMRRRFLTHGSVESINPEYLKLVRWEPRPEHQNPQYLRRLQVVQENWLDGYRREEPTPLFLLINLGRVAEQYYQVRRRCREQGNLARAHDFLPDLGLIELDLAPTAEESLSHLRHLRLYEESLERTLYREPDLPRAPVRRC